MMLKNHNDTSTAGTGTTWLAPERTSPRHYGTLVGLTGREVDFLDWDSQNTRYRLQHMHYRHRDYSPAIGRFMQHDPLGLGIMPISDGYTYNFLYQPAQYNNGINIYGYVIDNPINSFDSFGLACQGKKDPITGLYPPQGNDVQCQECWG